MTQSRVLVWLNREPHQRTGIAVFQRAIGAAVAFRLVTEWPFAAYLWGPQSLATRGALASGVPVSQSSLSDGLFSTLEGTYALVAVLFAAACGLLFQRATRLSSVVAFAGVTILGTRLAEMNDGGDNLATLALLYMMFVLPARSSAPLGSIRVWIHNLAVVAICVQVCVVYFVAGFQKMYGEVWHNGTALYVISQVEWFSTPGTRAWFMNPVVATVATYSTMIFQVWFPLALFSRLKFAFIALAMFFHLGIAVTMGLLTFSVVMAGADLVLISDADYRYLRQRWVALLDTIAGIRLVRSAPAYLFLDGDCAVCRAFGRNVIRLKGHAHTAVLSIRETRVHESYGIAHTQAKQRMHMAVPDAARVLSGFDVLMLISWRSVILWPALPVLYGLGVLGFGDTLYRVIAERRYLFNSSCAEHCLPQR